MRRPKRTADQLTALIKERSTAVWTVAGKNDDAALFDERYLGDLGQSG